jgi:DNA-binding NtrC family response regulator
VDRGIKILLIDDDDVFRNACQRILQDAGYPVIEASTGEEGLQRLNDEKPNLVFVDFKMPGMNGLEFLRLLRPRALEADVVMITGYASIEMAVEAIKMGAYDYIPKPFYPDKLLAIVRKIGEKQRILKKAKGVLKSDFNGASLSIIGRSQAMQDIFGLVMKVAPTDSTVLIMGESGTGKELIAKAIQSNSLRRKKPFYTMDCGSLVETLFESELFGHEKGSFTGAVATKHGAFELAHGGTFFFDEIGNISLNVQAKILRAIQEKEIRRVGSATTIRVDVRVIAATNKDLRRATEEGTFREDLFYRISVIPVYLPALRDRSEDIPLLVEHFIEKYNSRRHEKIVKVSDEVMELFMKYRWPGNVRELENTIERAFVIEDTDTITESSLPPHLVRRPEGDSGIKPTLESVEKNHIEKVLHENQWNISLTARQLGIDRKTLYDKIKKFRLN